MKITFMTLQKASIVCLGVGMFLALGSAGTFETTGEIQTGVYVAAFVFLLAAGLLMRLSFALQDYEEKQRKIHKWATTGNPSARRTRPGGPRRPSGRSREAWTTTWKP